MRADRRAVISDTWLDCEGLYLPGRRFGTDQKRLTRKRRSDERSEGSSEFFLNLTYNLLMTLVPWGRALFSQHEESQPLGRSNTESPRDSRTFRRSAHSQSQVRLTNLIGWEHQTITVRVLRKLDLPRWSWPKGARPLGKRLLFSCLHNFGFIIFIHCLSQNTFTSEYW